MDKPLTEHLTFEDAHQMLLDALKRHTDEGLTTVEALADLEYIVAFVYEQGRKDERVERGQV